MSKTNLARLKDQLRAVGITQQRVADAAGVTLPHVCNVLAGRFVSHKVCEAARMLLEGRR